jgi:thiol:disulfide interchange protein DsbD
MTRLLIFLLSWFAALTGIAAEEPLEAEQAYHFSARAVDAHTIEARWTIVDGYYLYREKFRFSAEPATVKLGEAKFPPGHIKQDEIFGRVEIYRKEVKILVPVIAGEGTITLKAVSQGCWDGGVCFPPTPQKATLILAASTEATPAAPVGLPATAEMSAPQTVAPAPLPVGDESSRIARLLKNGGLWLAVASFFGFGLLLCLTPCVLPMVPILSGIIVNHGHAVTHGRAFALSLSYVLGMAVTYAAVGVAAGLSGTLLSNALQNAWVLTAFALVFVVLSLSMFGFYELQLPAALQGRLSERANRLAGGLPALFAMGILSALIVGPCIAAPLAGALLYIAQTGDATLGGAALFAMALGMGLPLLVVGVFSRSLLPKPGPWMEAVKKFFGVVMLATALWMVSPVIPAWSQMLGFAALLVVPAMYMHAIDPLPAHASGWHRLWKGVGVLMLLMGAALVVGVLGGARDPVQPLGFLKCSAATPDGAPLAFERVKSAADLDARLKTAGRPVMLDFYADWCVTCKEMERDTFADPRVQAKLKNVLLLQADVTAGDDAELALLKRFGFYGPPGIVFFDAQGKEVEGVRVVGYQPPDQFLASLAQGLR